MSSTRSWDELTQKKTKHMQDKESNNQIKTSCLSRVGWSRRLQPKGVNRAFGSIWVEITAVFVSLHKKEGQKHIFLPQWDNGNHHLRSLQVLRNWECQDLSSEIVLEIWFKPWNARYISPVMIMHQHKQKHDNSAIILKNKESRPERAWWKAKSTN